MNLTEILIISIISITIITMIFTALFSVFKKEINIGTLFVSSTLIPVIYIFFIPIMIPWLGIVIVEKFIEKIRAGFFENQ